MRDATSILLINYGLFDLGYLETEFRWWIYGVQTVLLMIPYTVQY